MAKKTEKTSNLNAENSAKKTEKILELGPVAAFKAYQNILKKIQKGEILKPQELKSKEILEEKLKSQIANLDREKAGLPPTIVDNIEAVAAYYGKSIRQVHRWRSMKDFPAPLSGGHYDLMQIQAWLDRRRGLRRSKTGQNAEIEPESADNSEGKDFWDKENKRFQAKMRELEYLRRRGELIEAAEVQRVFVARIMSVKQGLLSLPRSLPPLLVQLTEERQMEAVIRRMVIELLEKFSQPLPDAIEEEKNVNGDMEPD